jgi:hypothetical protein
MTNVCAAVEADVLTIKVDISDVVTELKARVERLRAQWEENEWYLGEARASVDRLELQLAEMREACGRLEASHAEATLELQEQVRQRDEANWYLGELRVVHEALRQQTRELIEQLARARDDVEIMRRVAETRQDDVDVERARRKAAEADLYAIRRHGERRGAVRRHRPDMVAEVRAPDGLLLFHGCPPNISLSGLAFATDQSIDDTLDFVEVTIVVPGAGRPIEGVGRLVWREEIDGIQQWGCELLDLLPDCRKSLEDVLANGA